MYWSNKQHSIIIIHNKRYKLHVDLQTVLFLNLLRNKNVCLLTNIISINIYYIIIILLSMKNNIARFTLFAPQTSLCPPTVSGIEWISDGQCYA